MNKDQNATLALDYILAILHEELERGASADRVREIADENSDFHSEILAFAAEWFASDGSDLTDEMLTVTRTVSGHAAVLERFWEVAKGDAVNPFASIPHESLKTIANDCRIDMPILRQLVRGFVDESTIPGKLISSLADATNMRPAQVWNYLSSPALAAAGSGDFFAPRGKSSPAKVSFADVVRGSSLSSEDKQFWLAHLGA
ncbi:hypothetical protein [Mesorhizobium silamurunense]|uniref:hypothetical protein n=1 Tax=Mesorhizobium silamurunense TaxID=499528 RepID=UPI00177DEDD0|nr:hypothetical protein [Mesorhizobium silamurunense]